MIIDRNKLIETLKTLHPEIRWGEYPMGDYIEHAEEGAPDVLVCFGNEDADMEDGLVDPYSTLYGEPCDPSHWGISEQAAQLIKSHNRVSVS